jgi:tetratricopeptide (TPR) repeat protein
LKPRFNKSTKMNRYIALLLIFVTSGFVKAQTFNAEQIFEAANNTVVTIYAYDNMSKIIAQGSGVVLNDKGWIVTNYHVFHGSDKLLVKHKSKIIDYSEIVGADASRDILILKINNNIFPSIKIGDSDKLKIGQKIFAIGSPEGFENTISEGIISGLRGSEDNFDKYIQISAPVSHGSSGGAIINTKGELIGISTLSVVSGQNLNFAIPVNDVMKVYKEEGLDSTELLGEYLFWRGFNYYADSNFESAKFFYELSLTVNPRNATTSHALGLIFDKKQDYDSAFYYYNRAIQINPYSVRGFYSLGLLSNRKNRLDDAIYYFKKAISADKNFVDSYYLLGIVYGKMKDIDSEIYYYKKVIEIDPKYNEIYYALALAYARNKEYTNSILTFEKHNAIIPNDSKAYYLIGCNYEEMKIYGKAIFYYTKAIEIDPMNEEAYSRRGNLKSLNKDFVGAIADFTKVISVNPREERAFHNRANAKYSLRDFRGAIADYTKAIEINPNFSTAYYGRGLSKLNLNETYTGCLDLSKSGELGYVDAYAKIQNFCN